MRQKGDLDWWAPLFWRAMPLLLAAATITWLALRTSPPLNLDDWPALLEATAAGDADAGRALSGLAAQNWPAMRPQVIDWMEHPSASVRAIATAAIADLGPERAAPELVARASDDDYRVRAAAFTGLARVRPFPSGLPSRDTPIAERDRQLADWIRNHEGTRDESRLRCGLHLHSEHLRLASETIAQCLRCHVGPLPHASMSPLAQDCLDCHPHLHSEWNGSAHANSVSHINLRSIDPETKQPMIVSPAQPGLHCAACHAIDPAKDSRGCIVPFARAGSESCVSCHQETGEEWRRWARGARPERSKWLAGDLRWEKSGTPASCVDCHMTTRSIKDATWQDHRWAARRDPSLLAAAIHVEAIRAVSGSPIKFTLTNLTGHALPTAIERRAIELWIQPEGEAEPQLAIRFAPSLRSGEEGLHPPLAPGEQRQIDVSVQTEARWLHWNLRYRRNRHDPAALEVEFASGRVAIHK